MPGPGLVVGLGLAPVVGPGLGLVVVPGPGLVVGLGLAPVVGPGLVVVPVPGLVVGLGLAPVVGPGLVVVPVPGLVVGLGLAPVVGPGPGLVVVPGPVVGLGPLLVHQLEQQPFRLLPSPPLEPPTPSQHPTQLRVPPNRPCLWKPRKVADRSGHYRQPGQAT